jgi:hypothetical protein
MPKRRQFYFIHGGKQLGTAWKQLSEWVALIVDWFDDAFGEALYSPFWSGDIAVWLGIVIPLSRIEQSFLPICSICLWHKKRGGGVVLFDLLKEIEREKQLFLSQSVQVYRKRIKSFEISASNLKASRHTPFFLYFLLFLCKLLREVLIDQKLACHESICLIPFSHSSWSVCCVCVRGKSLGPNIMTSILPQSVSYPGSISSSLPSRVSPRLLHSQLCIALSICT